MTWLRLAMVVLLSAVFALTSCAVGQAADYPWVYYFERPDFPQIHCAFADTDGSVVVSTGDWLDTGYDWVTGDIVYYYRSAGLYRIICGTVEPIECPANTFVLDAAVDSEGTTWLLIAHGRNGYVETGSLAGPTCADTLGSAVGYRNFGLYLENYRFARLEGATVIEDKQITEAVPTTPITMCCDPWGRVYVFSWRWSDNRDIEERRSFVSWWSGGNPDDLHVSEISNILHGANMDYYGARYPAFGPDGLAYFVVGNAWDFAASTEYAVLCLDPKTQSWEVYDEQVCSLLGCAIRYFCVDSMNVKWFGTEDGLVRFDGQSWSRYTTGNTGLPHNLVRQIQYDQAEGVYYVVTQADPQYRTAFSVLSPGGRLVGGPLSSPREGLPWYLPQIYRDVRGTWWLLLPPNYRATTTPYDVYAYDGRGVFRWDSRVSFDRPDVHIGFIGSDAEGRDFCVGPTCVMIW
ncbi:MAG TPA: hypothetical protein VM163_03900 [bacterium]|nr:hypothetical protein [bacterium]